MKRFQENGSLWQIFFLSLFFGSLVELAFNACSRYCADRFIQESFEDLFVTIIFDYFDIKIILCNLHADYLKINSTDYVIIVMLFVKCGSMRL